MAQKGGSPSDYPKFINVSVLGTDDYLHDC